MGGTLQIDPNSDHMIPTNKVTVGYCWYLLLVQKLPFPPHLPIASPRPVSRAACSAAAGASDLYRAKAIDI